MKTKEPTRMKNKIFATAIALFLGIFGTQAQQNVRNFGCGTQPTQEFWDWFNALDMETYASANPNRTESTIFLPVQFHLVGPSNGAGRQSTTRALDLLCSLNSFYKPVDIQFYMPYNINIILNDNLFDLNDYTEGSQLMIQNNRADVVNVYITKLDNFSGAGFAICGYATLPGTGSSGSAGAPRAQGGMVLGLGGCTDINGTTFPHEMGHFLSMLHPFQTTSVNPISSQAELVARPGATGKTYQPNCGTNGDRLCDTEADYLQGGWSGCNMNHTQRDRNNDVFGPDPTLYMSYSPDNCQTRFSTQQNSQMRSTCNGQRSYLQALASGRSPVDSVWGTANLITPADQAANIQGNWTSFRWNSVKNAEKYLLQIATARTFNPQNMLMETTLADTQYLYTNLQMNTSSTYFWRVRPYRTSNTCGFPSAIRSFTCSTIRGFSTQDLNATPFDVYPNVLEGRGFVTAQLSQDMSQFTATLLDIHGRTLSTQSFNQVKNGQLVEIEINANQTGMYILSLETEKGRFTQKIMVK
jgi:hypothetical protein